MAKKILHVYEATDRIYAGIFTKIENEKFTLTKGVIIKKENLPEGKYSEEKIKEFYLEAEKNRTTTDIHFGLENIIKPHTIFL